jgi:hypothetical protein
MRVPAEADDSKARAASVAQGTGEGEPEQLLRLIAAAIGTFLIWRGALLFFDLLGLSLTANMGPCREAWQVFGKGHDFLNGLFRWDSGWYLNVANKGYKYSPNGASSVAFFPLLPYLARYLGLLLGSIPAAGLVICNVATIGAVFYLRRLGKLLFADVIGKRAAIFLLVFPSSLFLSAFYTEALFICLASAAMYHYFRRQFLCCGLLGCGAMLSRSTGIALFGALLLDLAWQHYRHAERFQWRMLLLLLIPAGLGMFMLMLQYQVGDPLAFSKVLDAWGRHKAWPWEGLVVALAETNYGFAPNFGKVQRFIDALSALGFLALALVMALKRQPVALWAFVALATLLPLLTFNLTGMNRYVLVLFPTFLFLAQLCQRRPGLERWLIFASSFFLAIYSLRFMQCGWAG